MGHDRELVSMFETGDGRTYALRSDGRVVVSYQIEGEGVSIRTARIAFGGLRVTAAEFAQMKADAARGKGVTTHGRTDD